MGSISPAAHSTHNSVNHGTKWLNIKAHEKAMCMLARLLRRGNKARSKETFIKVWFSLVLVLLCQIIFFFFFLFWWEYRDRNHTNQEDSSSVYTASQPHELRCKPSGIPEPGAAPCCTTQKLRKNKWPRTYLKSSSFYSTIQHSRGWWGTDMMLMATKPKGCAKRCQ